ncbi:alpha/beta fold hydrolase [Maricaulaceae bacterium MS644]
MLLRILGALLLIAVLVIAAFAWLMQPVDRSQAEAMWMTDEDRMVEAAGQTWRVRESGPETAPAVVLIHGFSHSLESLEPLADALEIDHRVIRFDLPGHALTGPREDGAYSVDATVNQVAALLDQVAPDSFVLGGHSLGGLVAWRYGAANPQRVDGLVLIAPGGYPNLSVGDVPAPVPQQVRLFLTAAPMAGVEAATAALYADPSRITDTQLQRIHAMMRVEGVGPALVERIEQFTLPDPNPVLREIGTPALILWGQRDAMISPEHGPRFAAAMPDAALVLIEDAGHMPVEEQPDASADAVRAFLDGLER